MYVITYVAILLWIIITYTVLVIRAYIYIFTESYCVIFNNNIFYMYKHMDIYLTIQGHILLGLPGKDEGHPEKKSLHMLIC